MDVATVCKVYRARYAFLAALALLAVQGCADRDTQTITDACVRAGTGAAANVDPATLKAYCKCSAVDAKKYLDKDDYKLLLGVAEIYNTDEPDDVKLHKLINGMIDAGVTPARATTAAMDMMFLAHKVKNECEIPSGTT